MALATPPALAAAASTAPSALPPLLPRAALFTDPARLHPQVAPDGARLGWLEPDGRGILQVQVGALDGSGGKPVTAELRPVRKWLWSADGREVLFLQDTLGEENDHLFSADLATGQLRDLTPLRGVRTDGVMTSPRHPRTVLVSLNLRARGAFDLYRLDLDTGALVLEATNPGSFASFMADPDLVVRGAVELLPDGSTRLHLREGDGTWRPFLTAPLGETLGFVSFSPGGGLVRFLSSQGSPTTRLVERELASGTERVLAEDGHVDLQDAVVDPRTGAVEAVLFEGLRRRWVTTSPMLGKALAALRALEPEAEVVPLPPALEGGEAMSRDLAGRWLVVALTEDRVPPRYAIYDATTGQARLLFPGSTPAPRHDLARQEPFTITARDGRALPAYLSLPAGAAPKGLPLVLLVHGGPAWRDSWGWHPITQWLTNRGYAVLRVNFRASTGFGTEHARAGYRQFGARMQDDLTDAVVWAVKRGTADPRRVAIMGKSYGGYAAMAGAALTPDLYRCAVSYAGVADLVALVRSFPPYWAVATAHIKALFGDPDDARDAERMRSVSPIHLTDRIRVPLLIGQGSTDVRVRKEEADQIFEALEKKGGRATYVLYADEGHGPAGVGPDSPANRQDWYARVERFLAPCLGGRAEPLDGERVPGSTAAVREAGGDRSAQ
jgi:dipeptidyl aminopeptidase/acylaminoacyl peptidase